VAVNAAFSIDTEVRMQPMSGCERANFGGLLDLTGLIALLQVGGCEQAQKVENAADAGAAAATIMEAGEFAPLVDIGKDRSGRIPVVAVGCSLGAEWASSTSPVVLNLAPAAVWELVATSNVWVGVGEDESGMVVVGAHLDSVKQSGPGVNDNAVDPVLFSKWPFK
jgi:hypothetical protein